MSLPSSSSSTASPAAPPSLPCHGRRVLVTAGASGIGAAIVQALLGAGARVHIGDIDQARLDAFAAEHPAVGVSLCDVSDEGAVARMVAQAAAQLGGIDGLVNNAGISGPTAAIDATETAAWQRTFDINVHGSFFCTRATVPHLRAAGTASIINISSVAGRLGFPLRSAYVGSKWALIGLTKTWAMELGPAGVGVNALLPGLVEGPRIRSVIAARAAATGKAEADIEAGFLADISLRRMVRPDEVASLAVYLLSPAGRNISGQTISVDGNFEVIR